MRLKFSPSSVKLFVCFSALAFAQTAQLHAQSAQLAAATTNSPYVAAVEKLLDIPSARQSNKLASARQAFTAAERLAKGDPWVDYAYGLVLHKLGVSKEAAAHFQKAADAPGKPCLPALQATIWVHVASEDWDPGLKRLKELLDRIQRDAKATTRSVEALEAATWLGRVMGYLESPASDPGKFEAQIAQFERSIGKTLSEEYLYRYEDGKAGFWQEFEIKTEQQKAIKLAEEQKALDANQKRSDALAEEREKAADTKEQIKTTSEKMKQHYDKTNAAFEKQLAALAKRRAPVEAQAQRIRASIDRVSRARSALEREKNRAEAAEQRGLVASINVQLGPLNIQLQNLQNSLRPVQLTLNQMSQLESTVERNQQAFRAEYDRQGRALAQKDKAVSQFEQALTKKEDTLVANPIMPSRAKTKVGGSLGTYLQLDFDLERERVLAAIGGK